MYTPSRKLSKFSSRWSCITAHHSAAQRSKRQSARRLHQDRRKAPRQTDRQTDRRTDGQIGIQTDIQTDRQINRYRQTGRQIDRQSGRKTRQTDKQATRQRTQLRSKLAEPSIDQFGKQTKTPKTHTYSSTAGHYGNSDVDPIVSPDLPFLPAHVHNTLARRELKIGRSLERNCPSSLSGVPKAPTPCLRGTGTHFHDRLFFFLPNSRFFATHFAS